MVIVQALTLPTDQPCPPQLWLSNRPTMCVVVSDSDRAILLGVSALKGALLGCGIGAVFRFVSKKVEQPYHNWPVALSPQKGASGQADTLDGNPSRRFQLFSCDKMRDRAVHGSGGQAIDPQALYPCGNQVKKPRMSLKKLGAMCYSAGN
jgi:hypothetical protein